MPQSRLTGSRIRERRLFLGQKQASLAKTVGISAAYLNLIEHNRRRVSTTLLADIATALRTDPRSLSEGAEAALLAALREAAQRMPKAEPELARVEDMAGRFPGWAALIASQYQRNRELEELVEALSDRLTHDPELAASLHEVISAVTAIRSTVGILTGGGEVDPDWQSRFMGNMRQEGRRLSDAAQGLVEYLDAGSDREMAPVAPGEELAAYLEARQHFLPELEETYSLEQQEFAAKIEAIVDDVADHATANAKAIWATYFKQYAADALWMPLDGFQKARAEFSDDLSRLAEHFDQPLQAVMRRLATVPPLPGQRAMGLVSCDGTGALLLRKPLAGFNVPRFGAACAYWPLYRALRSPGQPVREIVEMPGPAPQRFMCQAICAPKRDVRFDRPPVLEAVMLIAPVDDTSRETRAGAILPVGSSCRICPRDDCVARREASFLSAPASA
ncbi:short-chain fatty acyl-CoA regulator family protein [Aliiroseovarius sp. 2305UL8-7]|uniref:short-chain fatty acyl-CoA regulator family protein n=1 Tax=Aliiroseovarius conchicola TaxID=3121637 RepID=UPI00352974B7